MKGLIIVLICFFQILKAENSTPDSLFYKLRNATHDTIKIKTCIKIAEFHKTSIPDSSLTYLYLAKQLVEKTNNHQWDGFIYRLTGYLAFQKGDFKETLQNYEKALEIFKRQKDNYNTAKLIYLSGVAYVYLGDYKKALNNFFEARNLFEKNHFENDAADATIGIANIYGRLDNPVKELEFNLMALKIKEKLNDKYGIASAYINIGKSLSRQGKYDEAIEYTLKAIKISEEINNSKWLINSYGNLGSIYSMKKDFKNGLKYFLKCIHVAEKIGDKAPLGTVYGNVGKLYSELNMQNDAKKYYQKALTLSQEIGDMEQLKQNYYSFYEYFMDNKDYKNAVEHLKFFMSIKDSLLNESTTGQLNELQTKYETDKKEKEIDILNKDKEIQLTQIKQQKIINYGIVSGLLIVLVFSLILFNRLKITRQQKNLIELQKQEVETKNEIIEEKQKEILDSIHYAKRIQTTLITQNDFISNNLNDNFILFKPKDIVSGDFYWATKREHLFYLAVCDSTGHGVPGAFMSLLSINFLNEAINERKIESPDHIFNFVRKKLIDNLSKDGQQDGFDGALLCFNQKTKQITYAAANNAPIIIRNNEILILEADKMPVGKGISKAQFKLFELNHKPGDSLYLYTDGYADQFGGPRGKKFMYKQLNQIILSISNLEMPKQFEKLDYSFNNWRGNLEQVDDVCILGCRI